MQSVRTLFQKIYYYIEEIPDRLYPFASEIEGKFVRGRRSYLHAVERAVEKYGPHRLGYRLTLYRATFHLLGSILTIIISALLAQRFFGSEIALYVLIFVAILVITVQEFYTHPKRLGQLRGKGIFDWATWVVPMMLYLSIGVL